MRRIRTAALLLSFLLWLPCVHGEEPVGKTLLVLTVDNKIIGPVIDDYISRGIDQAAAADFGGVIILLDTPGGLLESTRSIVKKIMNSPVPVITYIAPSGSRAGSAGVFITLASHVAAMAPSTNIGAAHPVTPNGPPKNERSLKKAVEDLTEALRAQKKPKQQKEKSPESSGGDVMEDKILNDTIAWVETIAKNRGRNAEWARLAVEKSVSATEKQALAEKVIDLIALDTEDLLKKINGRTITMADGRSENLQTLNGRLLKLNLTASQNILNTLINPNIAYILMMIGFLGLFIELTHPGSVFPGVAGIISLILAFYAFAILPVNFAGFLLIGLSVIFLIAEILTPASFGLLTLAGIISMTLGSLMLIDSSFSGLSISLNVILPIVLAVGFICLFLIANVLKAHHKKIMTGSESLPGSEGIAQTALKANGEGQVFVNGELWSALNTGPAPVAKGEKIKVAGIDKIKLLVTKWEP
ncbi:MAG: nodulation protein NfeD [Candidatus Omnitrophota bacterium]